jgi:hypothetical protein
VVRQNIMGGGHGTKAAYLMMARGREERGERRERERETD